MATLNLQVGASSDDGFTDYGTYNDSSINVEMGRDVEPNIGKVRFGCRFTNVTIPKGSTINSAYLSVYVEAGTEDIKPDLYGINEDNTVTSSSGNPLWDRTLTTAKVNWNITDDWVNGVWYDSPDISTIIQEIINRFGWASGNALAIVGRNTSGVYNKYYERFFKSWNYSNHTYGAKLIIIYTLSSGSALTISLSENISAIDLPKKGLTEIKSDNVTVVDSPSKKPTINITDVSEDYVVTGAGDSNYNGTYTLAGTQNGYPYYTYNSRYLFYSQVPVTFADSWRLDTVLDTSPSLAGNDAYYILNVDPAGGSWNKGNGTNPPPNVALGTLGSDQTMLTTDAIIKSPNLKPNDPITVVDNFAKISEFKPTLSDTMSLLDTITVFLKRVIGLNFSDEASVMDQPSLSETQSINYAKNLDDTITLSDSNKLTFTKLLTDNIGLTDLISNVVNYLRTITDSLLLVDLSLVTRNQPEKTYKYPYSKKSNFNRKNNFNKLNNISRISNFTKLNNIEKR